MNEVEAIRFASWVETSGGAHGVRMPTPVERARSTGHGEYLLSLNLQPRQLFDAVGNHFDVDALCLRLRGPLRRYLIAGAATAPKYPDPAALLRQYTRLRADIEHLPGTFVPTRDWPWPLDLAGPLQRAASDAESWAGASRPRRAARRPSGTAAAAAPAPPPAAEDGRVAE